MVGIDESLLTRLTASVRDGHEVAVLASHIAERAGIPCVILLPRRDGWAVEAAARVALDVGRSRLRNHEIEMWLESASGRDPWHGHEVRHGEASVARVMLLGHQVTDEVIAACALSAPFIAARRGRGAVHDVVHSTVAQIVHDLGQPIAALALTHDALAHAKRLEPVLLERARRAVVRLRELTGDLLLLAAPKKRMVETVALGPLLAELIEDHADRATNLNVELRLEVRADVSLRGSRVPLLRAIGNVLANALGFSPTGGVVQLILDVVLRDRVVVEVRDQGPGVEPALRERVFDPFFTTRAAGNGLGLAVAKRVAQQHGGTVRFTDGPGGVVRFEFPPSRVVAPRALAPIHRRLPGRPAIL
jgi:signal transduction histidine kinase